MEERRPFCLYKNAWYIIGVQIIRSSEHQIHSLYALTLKMNGGTQCDSISLNGIGVVIVHEIGCILVSANAIESGMDFVFKYGLRMAVG